MFEKNVAGMVRLLREHGESSEVVSQCLCEIRVELRPESSPNVKVNALLKLGYLSMLGVDMQLAQMPAIEIMSLSNFLLKRPAMFVASLAFRDSPDIVLLTTNIFLKEFQSRNYLESATAVACMASVCTSDIASGVMGALLPLCTHSKAYVRKKTALSLFKLCEKNPNLFLAVMPKLQDLLADPDQSVQAAAVNTAAEIARRNAKLVVPLIPIVFHLLKEIKCNWILIKLLKLSESICAVEPRMWSKLVSSGVLADLNTKAKSVQVEFSRFVLKMVVEPAVITEKAVAFLKEFLSSQDPNIRCIALNIAAESHACIPGIFSAVLKAVDTSDASVRSSALLALHRLVDSSESATHAIQQLLALYSKFEEKKSIKTDIVEAILAIGARQALVTDTEWYLRILVLLSGDEEEVFSARILNQFKELAQQREPLTAVKIALAALNRPPALSACLRAACGWTLGFHALKNWNSDLFPPDVMNHIVAVLVMPETEGEQIEGQIDCVWGALKLAVAVYIKTESLYLLNSLESRIAEISSPKSLVVSEVCSIALSVISWIEAGDAEKDAVERLIFGGQGQQVGEKQTVDPKDFFFDFKHESVSLEEGLESSVSTEAYTDTEEEEGGKSEDLLFSIKSVLAK